DVGRTAAYRPDDRVPGAPAAPGERSGRRDRVPGGPDRRDAPGLERRVLRPAGEGKVHAPQGHPGLARSHATQHGSHRPAERDHPVAAVDAAHPDAERIGRFPDGGGPRHSVVKEIEARAANKNLVTGLETGLTDLDRMTGGFRPGNLDIVAGRPGL